MVIRNRTGSDASGPGTRLTLDYARVSALESFMRVRTRLLILAIVTALPAPALAGENFPPTLKMVFDLDREPDCLLCHTVKAGGKGTAETKFGSTLYDRGARGDDRRSLLTALEDAYDDRVDSDGDRVIDVQEVKDESDPNVADRHEPEPSAGGADGDGAGGDDGLGGDSGIGTNVGELPLFSDLDTGDLPPSLEHGCSLAQRPSGGLLGAAVLLAALAVSRRWRRPSSSS